MQISGMNTTFETRTDEEQRWVTSKKCKLEIGYRCFLVWLTSCGAGWVTRHRWPSISSSLRIEKLEGIMKNFPIGEKSIFQIGSVFKRYSLSGMFILKLDGTEKVKNGPTDNQSTVFPAEHKQYSEQDADEAYIPGLLPSTALSEQVLFHHCNSSPLGDSHRYGHHTAPASWEHQPRAGPDSLMPLTVTGHKHKPQKKPLLSPLLRCSRGHSLSCCSKLDFGSLHFVCLDSRCGLVSWLW